MILPANLIKYEYDINVFNFENDHFQLWFHYQSDMRISTAGIYIYNLSELNFNNLIYRTLTLLIRQRFQGYHCKSGIVIYAWRIT